MQPGRAPVTVGSESAYSEALEEREQGVGRAEPDRLRARGQTAPPLDEVRERIREVLVQRGISERANTWFEDTKSRLQVEITPVPAVDSKR